MRYLRRRKERRIRKDEGNGMGTGSLSKSRLNKNHSRRLINMGSCLVVVWSGSIANKIIATIDQSKHTTSNDAGKTFTT